MTAMYTQAFDIHAVKIREVLENLPPSEARTDCLGALDSGVNALERFLDEHLWLPAEFPAFAGEKESAYYLSLAPIEEILVNQELIYNSGSPY